MNVQQGFAKKIQNFTKAILHRCRYPTLRLDLFLRDWDTSMRHVFSQNNSVRLPIARGQAIT